jgi:hypothetical protein
MSVIENGLPAGRPGAIAGLARVNGEASVILDIVESADMPPTKQAVEKAAEVDASLKAILARWGAFKLKNKSPAS